MFSINSKRMTDLELMGLAKKRVAQRNIFKWHIRVYIIASILLTAIFIFICNGHFWPVWSILGWGLAVALHGVGINMVLSDSRPLAADEYNRLKGLAMVTEKMNGEKTGEENN